jgi:hypothetical protein
LKAFVTHIAEAIRIGQLTWDDSDPDLRGLAVNNSVRRQRDALQGTIALGEAGQGHLTVAFVRSFFEERLWITFLASMTRPESNALLLSMGRWDAIRSLTAQRDYIGDRTMTLKLWYPPGFVDSRAEMLPDVRADLKRLRTQWGWQGTLPSAGWIADQVSLRGEYEYLHSATSRALHFSAGEVLRRGWGTPGAVLVTNKTEFRAHLSEFAYDELWRQHLETLLAALDLLDDSAIHVQQDFWSDENRQQIGSDLKRLGRVPLVHAHEWNLEPPPLGTLMAWAVVTNALTGDDEHPEAVPDTPDQ